MPQFENFGDQMLHHCGQIDRRSLGVMLSCNNHGRNKRRDRGRLFPNFYVGGPTIPKLFGRNFQKARNFTASSHQSAGFSIRVFKKFSGIILRTRIARGGDLSRTQHPVRPLAGRGAPRCWDSNLGLPQLFSRGCAPGYTV